MADGGYGTAEKSCKIEFHSAIHKRSTAIKYSLRTYWFSSIWPYDHPKRLVPGKISHRPIIHGSDPVPIIDQRNKVYEQPHKPAYKSMKM